MPDLPLIGIYVEQGNMKGRVNDRRDAVLYTSDLAPCVAVCGQKGNKTFMIHSDSTGTHGKGATDLITGIRRVAPEIGTGAGWNISLIGGSVAGTTAYLQAHLPHAALSNGGATDGAYIAQNGVVANTKRGLAAALGVSGVTLVAPAPHPAPYVAMAANMPAAQGASRSAQASYTTSANVSRSSGTSRAPRR
jgi:hypothetical protein